MTMTTAPAASRSHPARRGLRFDEWPEADRAGWAAAIADGDVLIDSDLEPAYERNAPNGELCGPICDRTVIDIEL